MYNRPSGQIALPAGVDVDGTDSNVLLLATLRYSQIVITKNNDGHPSAKLENKKERHCSVHEIEHYWLAVVADACLPVHTLSSGQHPVLFDQHSSTVVVVACSTLNPQ